jgi:hypothetical protein
MGMNDAKLFLAGLSWWMNTEGKDWDNGAGDGDDLRERPRTGARLLP